MALARGMQVRPVQFDIPLLQVGFEQLYSQMTQMQGEKDQFDALKELMPSYLPTDADAATKFRSHITNLSDAVSRKFAAGDTQEAMRMLRQAKDELVKQWKPGGLATALQTRYDAYGKADEELKAYAKDSKFPQYPAFFREQLGQQLQKGIGYDPVKGTYNQISTPEMFAEVDLGGEVDTFLKGWQSDKYTGIERDPSGYYFWKGTTEEVRPEELQQALKSFYQQPHIQRAVGVSAWYNVQTQPWRQDPAYLQQRKAQATQALEGQIDQASKALNQLDEMAKSGNRGKITQVQETLRKAGFDIEADGFMGPQTRTALNTYLDSAHKDLADSSAGALARLDQTDTMTYAMGDVTDALTDAYVPKYSFTKKDVDIIFDQYRIALLKGKMQKEMQDAWMRMMQPQDTPMMLPLGTEEQTLESTTQQLQKTMGDYQKVEREVIQGLTPEWQRLVQQGGLPLDMRNYRGAPAQKESMAKYLQKLDLAARQAMRNNTFDPLAYEQALRQQGVDTNGLDLGYHQKMLTSFTNRETLANVAERLRDPYQAVEINQEVMRRHHDVISRRADEIDWAAVAGAAGIGKTLPGGLASAGRAGGQVTSFSPDANRARQLFENGDPTVMGAVDNYVKSHMPGINDELTRISTVEAVTSKSLEPLREQMKEAASFNLSAMINLEPMSKQERKQFGYRLNGDRWERDGEVVVEDVFPSVRNVNGTTKFGMLIKTSSMDQPRFVPMDQVNKEWLQNAAYRMAQSATDPENVTIKTAPAVFNTAAALLYNMEQDPSTAWNADVIRRMRNQGVTGAVGTARLNIPGRGEQDFNTFVVNGGQGEGSWLVTTSNPQLSRQLSSGRVGVPFSKSNMDAIRADPEARAVRLGEGYDAAKDAVMTSQALIYTPILEQGLQRFDMKAPRAMGLSQDQLNNAGMFMFNPMDY